MSVPDAPPVSSLFQGEAEARDSSGAASAFQLLKPTCVALLGSARINPSNNTSVKRNLKTLLEGLKGIPDPKESLTPNLIEYVFVPISAIFRLNPPHAIPDDILEVLLHTTAILVEQWWWSCSIQVWEQLFMLCSSLLAGPPPTDKAKQKLRREETREAAVRCLLALTVPRTDEDEPLWTTHTAEERLDTFSGFSKTRFTLVGQTLNGLLADTASDWLALRSAAMEEIAVLVQHYIKSDHAPTVLPAVVSAACKCALGKGTHRGWQSADVVRQATLTLGALIIASIGDTVCEAAGIVQKTPTSLEELGQHHPPPPTSSEPADPFRFERTTAWLDASASQIHIALHALLPLLHHPSPNAQLAFAKLCSTLAKGATKTLSSLHTLFLTSLLQLSLSDFKATATEARTGLEAALPLSSTFRSSLIHLTRESLLGLSSLIMSKSEPQVERTCKQIIATCRLRLPLVAIGVGKLLGPQGGVEKWGSALIGSIELVVPPITVAQTSVALIMDGLERPTYAFPDVQFKGLTEQSAVRAIRDMLLELGVAGGTDGLFSLEWLLERGTGSRGAFQSSSLWSATCLMEGVASAESSKDPLSSSRRKLDKVCRNTVKELCELWEIDPEDAAQYNQSSGASRDSDTGEVALLGNSKLPTEYIKGIAPLQTLLDFGGRPSESTSTNSARDIAVLHAASCLRLIATAAEVLGSRTRPLLLHILYPVLRSLVSRHHYLSSTALAALHSISSAAGYASPSNLLLANFDYALDSISRRLLRGRMDPKAMKVMLLLVKLVGKDVVHRAGDVVEECFDRLDEFHGYSIVVEGIVEVLAEVVAVVAADDQAGETSARDMKPASAAQHRKFDSKSFRKWYSERRQDSLKAQDDFVPAPHRPWTRAKPEENAEEAASLDEDPALSPTSELVAKIVKRSIPFLTHSSPLIRARILSLLRISVSLLPPISVDRVVHKTWPFTLNRLQDAQPFVVEEAAQFVGALSLRSPDFMAERIWQDIWPAYRRMLDRLEEGDRSNALVARMGRSGDSRSKFVTSHKLYRAILGTLESVFKSGNWVKDDLTWEVTVKCRRFLASREHPELQAAARSLYFALARHNPDMVWLVLTSTCTGSTVGLDWLRSKDWDISSNAVDILK